MGIDSLLESFFSEKMMARKWVIIVTHRSSKPVSASTPARLHLASYIKHDVIKK